VVERPRRPSLLFEDLEQGDENALVLERAHDGVAFADPDLSGEKLFDRDLLECTIIGARLDDANLRGSRLRETRVERAEATTVQLDHADLREVEFDSCRFGALDLFDSQVRIVRFSGCRLGYVNLRGSELIDVTFEDCTITDLDLGGATVSRLALPDCRVDTLLVREARLGDVDLRGITGLQEITGVEGLRGATIGPDQLADLAPILAAHFGIEIG